MKKNIEEIPFISVIIPTYNSGEYISETLKSVFSQTYNKFELIVSDDGSSDNTVGKVKDILDKYLDRKTKLLINEHEGPGATRNKGIKAANGEWISFLDSDDLWFPQKLQKVADFLHNNQETDLVCHTEIWKNNRKEVLLKYSDYFNHQINPFLSLYRGNALSTSAITVRRELLIDAGMFDTTLASAQDYDLWLRLGMIKNICICFIDEPLGMFITRKGSIGSNIEERLRCKLKISKKYYEYLRGLTKFPYIEKTRVEGIAYATSGLLLIRRRNLRKGILFFTIGMVKWPFRYDWLCKIVKILLKG